MAPNEAVTWHGIGQADCECELCKRCVRCRRRQGTHIGPWRSWYCAICHMAYTMNKQRARSIMEGAPLESKLRRGL